MRIYTLCQKVTIDSLAWIQRWRGRKREVPKHGEGVWGNCALPSLGSGGYATRKVL